MSERYSKLFALPENLYASGAPVVIAAGALLKDNQTGKVIAQLKLRNIGANNIKAAKVCIHPFDTVGNALGAAVEYQYLDLAAKRNEEFGAKSPIPLADTATRAYSVSVAEVVFTDNTVWKATDEPWETLSVPATLDNTYNDSELVKQYRVKFGADCKYNPTVQKDLWYCACGELNHKEETICHHCGKSLATLQAIDISALKTDRDARIAAEKQKAAEDKDAAAEKAKKIKRLAMIITPIIVILIIAAVLISGMVRQKQEEAAKLDAYNAAVALLENGEYSEAISALSALGGYKDSDELIKDCEELIAAAKLEESYYSAMAYIEDGKYSQAAAIFEQLGDYKDCKEQLAALELPLFKEELAGVKVGGTFIYGTYEQDNNTENGAEPIQWIVLQSDTTDFPFVMAISKYVLDAQPFHSERGFFTWENCSLRTWLNNDFLTSAFTDEEIALLSPAQVSTPDNPTNGTDCGNDTIDTVFLLCAQDASYWADVVGDETLTTAYAQSKGLDKEDSWMFRTVIEVEATSGVGVCVAWDVHSFGGTWASLDSPSGVRPCIMLYVGNE